MSNIRYNKYARLFGRDGDDRPKLFISILEDQLKETGDVVLTKVPKQMDASNFKPAGEPGEISPEWALFIKEATAYVNANKADVVSRVKTLGGASTDPVHNNVAKIALKVLTPKDGSGNAITTIAGLSNTQDVAFDVSHVFSNATVGPKIAAAAAAATAAGSLKSSYSFSYNFTPYFVTSLLEEACASADTGASSAFFADEPETLGVYRQYRPAGDKGCAPTMLAVEDKDGRSGAFDHLRKHFDDKCATTGVTDDGNETCQSYLQDCLKGKNIEKCARFMKNDNFWENAAKEVENMNPLMVIRTLEAFKFPISIKNGIRVVPSAEEWLKGVTELSVADKQLIEKNHNLMGYLNMLVRKTEIHPTILNPSTNVRGSPSSNTRLNKMGVRHVIVNAGLNKDLNQWINTSRAQTYRVGNVFGIPMLPNGLSGILSGGGYTNNLDEFTKRNAENYVGTADMFGKHVEALNGRLQAMGKQIHQGDLAKINQLIDSLRNSERKLNKTMLYAEKYARLLEVHGIKDNSAHVLSMDHLKEFVDQRNKYFDRVNRRQSDLYSILTSIAEAVAAKDAPVATPSNYAGLL